MPDAAFDPVAVVVDWLDSCRARTLDDLLHFTNAAGSHDGVIGSAHLDCAGAHSIKISTIKT